jgi:tol-pal system protein YbgF
MHWQPVSAAILLLAASAGIAQVQIVESQPVGGKTTSQKTSAGQKTSAAADAGAQAELYYQLQLLQQEVQELRGLVEQQSFELRQLKQQRMDDYLDLDRRLSQSPGAGAATTASPISPSQDPTLPAATDAAQADELAAYRGAIDLVLKQKDFDGGAAALQKYLRDFPSGHYTANALYWLGQIYLQKNDSNQSQKWFQQMIDQYPTHQKTPEAKLKLAKVYHAEGETAKARKLLEEVASSGSPAAGLAKEFLQQNY